MDTHTQMMGDMRWQAGVRMEAARRAALSAKSRLEGGRNGQTIGEGMQRPSGTAWTFDVPYVGENDFPPAIDGNQILLLTRRHSPWGSDSENLTDVERKRRDLNCLDLETGKVLWKVPVNDLVVTWPSFAGDLVVYGTKNFQVVGLDRKSGVQRFRAQLDALKEFVFGSEFPTVQELLHSGDHLFVATYGKGYSGRAAGTLYALDLATGKVNWSQGLAAGAMVPPVCLNDLIVVAGGEWVQAFQAKDGAVAWKVQIPGDKISKPLITLTGSVFVHALDLLHALEGRTGKVSWTAPVPRRAMVQGHGNCVYFSYNPGVFLPVNDWVFGLNAETGKTMWETKLGFNKGAFWMNWWTQDGMGFFAFEESWVGVNLVDGKEKWRVLVPGAVGAPLPINGLLLVVGKKKGKGYIHALRQSDGTQVWVYDCEIPPGPGLLEGGEKGLLFPGKEGKLICLR